MVIGTPGALQAMSAVTSFAHTMGIAIAAYRGRVASDTPLR